MSVVKLRFALVSVLSLVFSVFVPLSTAPATAVDNSFAKTVTVLGANGQPYAGAEVALVSVDNQNQTWVPGTPAITDSSGVAVVTGLTSNTYAALTVEPPVSDSTTAIFTSQIYGVASLDESMTVNLSASNMRVNILTAAGAPAPAGSFVNYPSELVQDLNKTVVTTRTGAFGLAITTKAGQKDAFIGVGGPTDFDSVNRNYALRLSGTGSSATRTLYTDDTFTTVKTPVSSVYQLSLLPEELHGRLKTSSGANLTLPSGVHGRVVFTPAKIDGTLDRDFQGPKSKLFNTDGTFTAALPTQKAGKFFSQILLSGSTAFPSFTGPAVWLDASGKYSSSGVNGSYVSASSFVLEVRLPSAQPNLVINAKDSSGVAQPSYIDLVDQSNSYNWWGPNDTTNGIAAYVLPDSNYSFSVTPFSLAEIQSPNYFNVSVASGVASVSDQNGNDVAPNSDAVYVIQSVQPNVQFSILAAAPSNNPLGSGNLQIFDNTGRFITSFGTYTGIVDSKLDDGTYKAEIIPDGNAAAANVVYTVTVANGVASVKNSSDQDVTAVNGRFPLHADTPNAVFGVVSPTDPTVKLQQGAINYSKADGNWDFLSTSGKTSGIKLEDGTFDFDVFGGGVYAQVRYSVTKAGSSITVTGPDGPVLATNGVFLLSPAVANVVVRVVNPNDTSKPLTNSFVNVSPADGSYSNGYGTWDQPIAVKLTDGDYYFDANSNTPGYASARYSVTVAGTSVTVRNPDGLDVSAVDGIFPISPTTPNVTLKVVDPSTHTPIDGAYLEVLDFQTDQFVSSTGAFHGMANFKLANGKYRVRVHKGGQASAQLADSEYVLELTNGIPALSTKAGSPVTSVNGVFEAALSSSNLQFQIKAPGSSNLLSGANLALLEIDSNKNYGRFVANADAPNGTAGFSVSDGHYAVEVHPWNSSTLAMSRYELTVSGSGTVFALKTWAGVTVNQEIDGSFIVNPDSPNLTIKIVDPAHPTQGIQGAYVNFQTESGQWLPGGGVNNAGLGSFKVPAGTYKLQVSPGGMISNLATKTYNLTVASDGTPTITDQANNVIPFDQGSSAFIVTPSAPNTSFKLVDPNTGALLRSGFASIFQAQGNDRGRWVAGEGVGRLNFALADGDYIVEVGGSSLTEAFANKMYKLHVASGVATFATQANQPITATNSVILLAPAAANVKFNIVDPVDPSTPLTQSWSNVFESVNGNRGNWIANAGGSRAAFSLLDGDYQIEINGSSSTSVYASKYVNLHVSGSTATYSTLAGAAINPGSDGISLSPAVPNVQLTIVDPVTQQPLAQSWANVFNRTTNQWVGGSGSNQGLLGFSLGQGLYTVEVNPGGDTNLAQKRYDFEVDSSGTVTFPGKTATQGRFALEATSPNLKLKVVSPSDSTKLLLNAYVNIQRTVDNQWVAGVGGNTGMLSLRLEDGTYNMQLEPGPNVTESLARKAFTVTVSGSGSTVAIQGLTADPSTHAFTISPATPAIKGIVKNPIDDSAVSGSWVEPTNAITGEFLGQFGANSGPNGQFAMAMADGTYKLSAQVPWNSGYNLAKSAPCTVTVANGAVTTNQGGCVQQDHSVVLTLRAPNVSFIVADANGNPLPNANVNIQFGAWNVWSNANSSGRVSLFIDPAEIHAANPTVTGTIHLHASLEPPYGTNSSVRTDCNQGSNDAGTLCAKLSPIDLSNPSTPYVSQTIGTINLAAPNTRLTVTHPDNVAVGAGAWVVLFKENANCPGCRLWLAGSNTGNDGVAAFNVTDTTGFFSVEVNPPYSERGTYAMVTYNHLTWAQVNATFSVASPNLKLTVDQPTTHLAAKWSYVNIETIDSSGNTTGWLPGSGTTEFGKTSLLLPNDGRFKLTIYPGGGSVGTRTTCNVQMAGGVVSLISGACATGNITSAGQLTVTLSRGNVSGTITHGTGHSPLAGAIVYAERVGGASAAQTFTTGEDGTFGFQLDQGDWTFKVFYVNEPGESIVPELNGVAKTISSQTNSPFEINLAG